MDLKIIFTGITLYLKQVETFLWVALYRAEIELVEKQTQRKRKSSYDVHVLKCATCKLYNSHYTIYVTW